MSIEVKGITKKFGAFEALYKVDLTVKSGELLALLGPSGSGKTTLLRVIAGLETADEGQVLFEGDNISQRNVKDRGVGFVFQHYALFRHMTVFENIAFGLRVRPKATRPSDEQIKSKVTELLKLIRLDGMSFRYPAQLSGGQRQRVALARALAIEPKMLLLDEPFGALDAKVRKELRQWLRDLHDKLHMTSVFVTHDQEEALEVADRIVVMNEGRIEQVGAPDEVYHNPATPFVYNFLGNVNFFHYRMGDNKPQLSGQGADSLGPKVYVRPHLLDIDRKAGKNSFRAIVKGINSAGPLARVEVVNDVGETIHVEMPQDRYHFLNIQKGEFVFVTPKEIKTFSEDFSI